MAINWNEVLTDLGTTASVVGAVGWVAKSLGTQVLSRDLESHKADLKRDADAEIERLRSAFAGDLERLKAALKRDADTEIERLKSTLAGELERLKAGIAAAANRKERARLAKERWANPIQEATQGLARRLENIQDKDGWRSLDPALPQDPVAWPIGHDYFLTSSTFLFAQFFCVESLLRRKVGPDLFPDEVAQDAFLKELRDADACLSRWPFDASGAQAPDRDMPVFNLQQRAIGEACTTGLPGPDECVSYHVFLDRWADRAFRERTAPLEALLLGLSPASVTRWARITALRKALTKIDEACTTILNDASSGQP